MTPAAPQLVRLDDYRRDRWTPGDLAWEETALEVALALIRGERLGPALRLPELERLTRWDMPADDPRRAATQTLLALWQLQGGNRRNAAPLLAAAERGWAAALAWLDRLRPGCSPEGQAECRHLVQQATRFTAGLAATDARRRPRAILWPPRLDGLPADRRKLAAAVAAATTGEAAGLLASEA